MNSREQFETWMKGLDVGFNLEFFSEYTDGQVQGYWETWQASRSYFDTIVMQPIVKSIVEAGVKSLVSHVELLTAAERYLDFRHTSDCGLGEDFSAVHPEMALKAAIAKAKGDGQKVCECGPLRNITDGGHFPACTRCKRRIKPC